MALCGLHGATLLVAKLDRLSRDAAFLMNLQKADVRFIAADMPEANEMTVGIMAVVAQAECKAISRRTKEALAAKAAWYAGLDDKQRNDLVSLKKATRLGGPNGTISAGPLATKVDRPVLRPAKLALRHAPPTSGRRSKNSAPPASRRWALSQRR